MNLLLKDTQLWVIILGSITPLAGYVFNKLMPWVDETVKGVVQVLIAAAVTALFTALDTSVFGFNAETAQLVLSGIASALLAHNWLWRPAKVNVKLGATETHHAVGALGTRQLRSDTTN